MTVANRTTRFLTQGLLLTLNALKTQNLDIADGSKHRAKPYSTPFGREPPAGARWRSKLVLVHASLWAFPKASAFEGARFLDDFLRAKQYSREP